jgi:hypothetical protein
MNSISQIHEASKIMANTFNEPRRVIMRIELYPQAKDHLMGLCDRLGMTQVATVSRVVEWFCEQTDLVQAAVLGLYPEDIRAEVASLILKHIARNKKK